MTKINLRWVAILPAVLWGAACSKPDSTPSGAPGAASAAPGVSVAPTGSSPHAAGAGAASGPPAGAAAGAASAGSASGRSAWTGPYKAEVGTLAVAVAAKDAKEGKGSEDSAGAALGSGTMDLAIEGARVRGQASGPLGGLAMSGVFEDQQVRAQALPIDPNANDAMTGWMLLRAEGERAAPTALVGTLRVSGRDARVVREASVRLTPK